MLLVKWNDKTFQVPVVHVLPQTWGQPLLSEVPVSDGCKWRFKAVACALEMPLAAAMAVVARSSPWTGLGDVFLNLKVKYLRSLY